MYALFKGVESAKVEEVTASPVPIESGARSNRPTHCVVGGAHAFILRVRSPTVYIALVAAVSESTEEARLNRPILCVVGEAHAFMC